jgi:hypothetical protein
MKFLLVFIIVVQVNLSLAGQQVSRAFTDSVPSKSKIDPNDAKSPVLVSAGKIIFPNAFLWNHTGPTGGYSTDKPDDYMFLPEGRNIATYKLQIFSRRGALVFESNDLKKGWDGYLPNGDLAQQGVYVWKASGKFNDGTEFKKAGDLTFLH